MKKYKIYLLLWTIVLSHQGCKKDFLEVPEATLITRQAYVKDMASMGEFFNGLYVILGKDAENGRVLLYPEIIADNLKPIVGGTTMAPQYSWAQQASPNVDYSFSSSSTSMNTIWTNGYRLARACSFVIENVDLYRKGNEQKADDFKAQAYAMRAFIHFQMVNIFAQSFTYSAGAQHLGIPYVTSSNININPGRSTVAEVYSSAIADLNRSVPLFKPGNPNPLYMNAVAVKALLSRIYLYQEDYQKAKNYALAASKSIPIMTGANYPSKLFTPQETEAIFQLPPSASGVNGGAYTSAPAGAYLAGSALAFNATADMADILKADPQDARNVWVTRTGTVWNVTKFPSNVIPGFSIPAASYYHTLLRSSEMYLNAAEAYAQLNNVDSARFYLDAIRKRANPAALPNTESGTALLNTIYKERRKELAFEGFRMGDLQRWRQPVNRQDAPNAAAIQLLYPSDKAIAPIPLPDVQLNGLLQNPGY